MYNLIENARKLGQTLAFYGQRKSHKHSNQKAELREEIQWNASAFYAEVLLFSEEGDFYFVDYPKLLIIQDIYNTDNNTNINVDDLIFKNWLRIVYGMVHIPNVIKDAAIVAFKKKNYRHELNFLTATEAKFEENKSKGVATADFERLKAEFETEHGATLQLTDPEIQHLCQEKDGFINVQNAHYYEPLLESWGSFLFIHNVYEHLYCKEHENRLRIKIENLEAIIKSFKAAYSLIPNMSELVTSGKFQIQNEDNYAITFNNDSTLDKTAAILWEKLLQKETFNSDAERLLFWYERIIHRSQWSDIGLQLTGESLNRFLKAATDAVFTDSDLANGQTEYEKLLLDLSHGRLNNLSWLPIAIHKDNFPNSENLYELYWQMRALDDYHQNELIFHQETRQPLAYFIRQIVHYESEYIDGELFPAIFKLLNKGANKPYLLWQVCFELYYWKPSLIPFLLLKEETAALSFSLIWDIEILEPAIQDKDEIRLQLLKSCFTSLLQDITRLVPEKEQQATIIFQCLLISSFKKFRIPGGNDIAKQKEQLNFNNRICNELRMLLTMATLPSSHFNRAGTYKKLLFPTLIEDLFAEVKKFVPADYRHNHMLGLPYLKLDILCWLLNLCQSNLPEQRTNQDNLIVDIKEEFLESYLFAINCVEMDGWDYFKNEHVRIRPSWFSTEVFNELIPWQTIVSELTPESLHRFTSPLALKLKKAENRYDEYNRFTANKIRTHISVLLVTYNRVYHSQVELTIKGIPVNNILTELENSIIRFVTNYCIDAPMKKRMDIFDDLFERSYTPGDNRELLPAIGGVMNKFTDQGKRLIIQELLKEHQLSRSLKLLNYVISEKDRQTLILAITSENITAYLEQEHSIDGIQFIMQELALISDFSLLARQALEYWNAKIVTRNYKSDDNKIAAYRIALIISFHAGDENSLNAIEEPTLKYASTRTNFSATAEKDFYRALIYLKNNKPQQAYAIFNNQLNGAEEERPVLALNRFAAKIQWADEVTHLEEKRKLYSEAIQEWTQFSEGLAIERLEFILEKVWNNQLHAYSALGNTAAFDEIYNKLDNTTVLRSDFLELRLRNLVQRKMQLQAEELIRKAEQYHRLSDGKLPEFMIKMFDIVETTDLIAQLKEQYRIIFSKTPEKLVQIISEDFNKYSTLPEAILFEIVYAANEMLTYINSISAIDHEDKYSDLLQLVLNGRLSMYGWKSSTTRGGQSFSGKANLGEIDFAIFSRNERICLCEAMILKGKNTTESQKHNFKIFNYGASRKFFFMIIYYKGKDYETSWTKYKSNVGKEIQFPAGHEMQSNELEDVSAEFGNNSIKVAKGIHVSGVLLYHIYININYMLSE
jgi:hypothetical protein